MTNEQDLDALMEVPFTFQRRPTPIPADMRPLRRVALLVLMLDKCQGGKASQEQLHVLNWAIRANESQYALLEFLDGKGNPDKPIVRFDPTLDRATLFAEGEGLVAIELIGTREGEKVEGKWPGYRVRLLELGRQLAKELISTADCFKEEREFLSKLKGKFTQGQITTLFSWETQ